MSFSNQFDVLDGVGAPHPWTQERKVATAAAPAVAVAYDPSNGEAKNETLQSLTTSWTNTTPVTQWVHGWVTKGGSQVHLQCRSRAYMVTSHGYEVGGTGVDIPTTVVSRSGGGTDVGLGGLLNLGGAFGVHRRYMPSTTVPFMPHLTGAIPVDPGQTVHARVDVGFISEYWENTQIDGGDADTESRIIAGELRCDLWATPSVTAAPTLSTPTVVGVSHDIELNLVVADTQTGVNVPAGTTVGHTLIAIVANQFGLLSDINPVESGWTQLAVCDGGWEDVHMKIYGRTVASGDPTTYHWTNGAFAEETAVIVSLSGVAPFDPVVGDWYTATLLSSWKLVEDHIAPSINRGGQLLLCVSYFNTLLQGGLPITQSPPDGMTEIVEVSGSRSSLAVAVMADPPRPTGRREFVLSAVPFFNGHSICASILLPGAQT